MNKKYSRREFLVKNIAGSAAFMAGGWWLTSFKLTQPIFPSNFQTPGQDKPKKEAQQTPKTATPNPCEDLTGVAPGELDKRKKFAYVNSSPNPDSKCGNCKLFLPPSAGKTCGGCLLFKGPVQESGYCTYWAPLE